MKIKRLIALLLALAIILAMAACGGGEEESSGKEDSAKSEAKDETTEEAKEEPVESDGYEKFSKLEIGMTRADVDGILGEPTKVDKAYHYYNVTVNGQDAEVEVWISTVNDSVIYISGPFDESEYRAEFADDKTDLSAVSDLESGALATYDDCVDAFKTEGYLMSIDEDGEAIYLWVDSTDGYLRVTFDAEGNVTNFSGYC